MDRSRKKQVIQEEEYCRDLFTFEPYYIWTVLRIRKERWANRKCLEIYLGLIIDKSRWKLWKKSVNLVKMIMKSITLGNF